MTSTPSPWSVMQATQEPAPRTRARRFALALADLLNELASALRRWSWR